MHCIVGASLEEGSHRYLFRGKAYQEKEEFLIVRERDRHRYDMRSGIGLGGGAVLENSGRMWCDGRALSVSAEGGAGPRPLGSDASTAAFDLLCLPAGGVLPNLSRVYQSLQNALRRLFLSMTWHSNPHLPPVSQPVAAQVPRGPP